jgi:hypothetical protein
VTYPNSRLGAVLMFLASVAFLYIGVSAEPRKTVYISLGFVFFVIGFLRLRRSRMRLGA